MFHRSQRLFLRPAFPEDCEAILAGINDEAVVRNLARAPWPYGMDDARSFAALPQDMRLPHFLVTLPGVGVIGSAGMGEHEGQPEIGYWIARDHWGRGYATEAAGAVLRIARTLGHRRVTAGHFVDNPASGKVLRKLGFVPTGRTGGRHSLARGGAVESVEYALDLEADMDPAPFARAA
ncbi:GNAT family N-acetyltransferase [uncultured Erythrobacter sp.]|uniref:GNAT family N-acetyltransferase n=1 Tax=uncultured Erythrobacter sp. TaxID=263913 RepID=UPI00265B6EBD|nr:GNAT family N-acetyltransferase [uncultured Erythrobacter sp.]